mgnify:CR=1 FL=1
MVHFIPEWKISQSSTADDGRTMAEAGQNTITRNTRGDGKTSQIRASVTEE